jgi:hypothetical protein
LRSVIQQLYPEIPALPRIKITEILYHPQNGDAQMEFLELKNFSPTAVDISDWTLEEAIDYTFAAGTVVASGETFVVAKSPADFAQRHSGRPVRVFGPYAGRLDNSGETILLRDAGPGYPATIDFVRYSDTDGWPLLVPGQSLELTELAATRDNDRAENWKASDSLGGTPGSSEVKFVRGDADRNGRLNITDALFIVNWLFSSGAMPVCRDAADVDDSGDILLTDAIFLLAHLFLSGPPPAPPHPEPGGDETLDSLSCFE